MTPWQALSRQGLPLLTGYVPAEHLAFRAVLHPVTLLAVLRTVVHPLPNDVTGNRMGKTRTPQDRTREIAALSTGHSAQHTRIPSQCQGGGRQASAVYRCRPDDGVQESCFGPVLGENTQTNPYHVYDTCSRRIEIRTQPHGVRWESHTLSLQPIKFKRFPEMEGVLNDGEGVEKDRGQGRRTRFSSTKHGCIQGVCSVNVLLRQKRLTSSHAHCRGCLEKNSAFPLVILLWTSVLTQRFTSPCTWSNGDLWPPQCHSRGP